MLDLHFVTLSVGWASAIIFGLTLRSWRRKARSKGLPLPPGPRPLPLIGNVFDINIAEPWLSYTDWGKTYGDLVYSNVLGQDFIVINSEKVARELLEQRSAIYSDRPYISTNKLFGMDFNTGLLGYGDKWRLHRKMFNMALRSEVTDTYHPLQLQKARQLVENLLNSPSEYETHVKTLSASIIMAITYGYKVAQRDDPLVARLERFIGLFLEALTPERAALIGAIPFLAYLPSWFPGGRYKRKAVECRKLSTEILNEPVERVKMDMAAGTAPKSMVSDLLEKYGEGSGTHDEQHAMKATAATVFLGGAETTDSTMLVFIFAMVLHPDVQRKAQEEIDRVVGKDRLPDFTDRAFLPYVEAVFLEVLRWRPTVPLALPHSTTTSDVYEGYYIPQGALLLANLWAITHNEERFPDPMAFKPERHLTVEGKLAQGTTSPSFGYGRRICPGRYLADGSVWASIVSVLATLRVSKAKDAEGNEIEIKMEFTTGLAIRPRPFACTFTSRSAEAEEMLRSVNAEGR
ncbi:cytochrome P450 [Leucogyrophana mollusca]|uniref:Cytochrome P450 n=1 Tax=Leucogyrophana mollusca TaxID=85980 RepID=A0ACB8BXQ3_9AGAM|nr:cytochrome P450 [Leucogyrophana mollusca]